MHAPHTVGSHAAMKRGGMEAGGGWQIRLV
jgi:hypothetical protein